MPTQVELIGRREELAFARRAIAEGAGVVLGGEAGVGKTRLARELGEGFLEWCVRWSSVAPSASSLPLAGLAGLGLALDASDTREGLLARLAANLLTTADGRRTLVIVDDAHLLDDLSAAFLHHLVSTRTAAVLLTVRSREHVPPSIVSLYKDDMLPRLEVQPLGRDDFGALARAVAGGPIDTSSLDGLWRTTGGNVLFLRELLADALETSTLVALERTGVWHWTPTGHFGSRLTEVVASRMGRLDGDRRALAELLAVGEPLSVDFLARFGPPVDLGDEERNGLITVRASNRRTQVTLAHPLFGEVLRDHIPLIEARDIQRRLADAFEQYGARRTDDPLRVAVWRMESSSASDVDQLLTASRLARAKFDSALAARLARAACELDGTFDSHLALGTALVEQGLFDDAGRVLDRLVGSEPDDRAIQMLARERAWAHAHDTDGMALTVQVLEEAEATLAHDPMLRSLARGEVALVLGYLGRFADALEVGAPLVGSDMPDVVRLRSLPPVGSALAMAGRTDSVLALCEDLDPIAEQRLGELPRAQGWIWQVRANALFLSGRVEASVELLAPALAPGRRFTSAGDAAFTRTKLARSLLATGRVRSAAHELTEALGVLEQSDPNGAIVWCLSLAAEAHALLGDLDHATRFQTDAHERRHRGFAMVGADAVRGRAWVTAVEGRHTQAIAELTRAADLQLEHGQPASALYTLHDAVRLGARELCDRVVEIARGVDGPGPEAIGLHAQALRTGDAELVEEAAGLLARTGMHLVAAEAYGDASQLWAATGRATPANAATRRRAEQLDSCEGIVITWGTTPNALSELTRREREIATLAGRGLSNAEIAEQLVISVRTVESHLYGAFTKLGITQRAELAAAIGLPA